MKWLILSDSDSMKWRLSQCIIKRLWLINHQYRFPLNRPWMCIGLIFILRKGNHNNSNVITCFTIYTFLQNRFNCSTQLSMKVLTLKYCGDIKIFPNCFKDVSGTHNIENPITFNLNESILARTIKSCWFWILKLLISGSATTTLGLPPNYSSFASISPKVLETESLPGKTLIGPDMILASSSGPEGV